MSHVLPGHWDFSIHDRKDPDRDPFMRIERDGAEFAEEAPKQIGHILINCYELSSKTIA